MRSREKIADALVIIAVWAIAIVLAYAVYLKARLLLSR